MFVIFKKLTKKEAEENIILIEKWFENNPNKEICKTDLFEVRKNHIREDVLKHTEE